MPDSCSNCNGSGELRDAKSKRAVSCPSCSGSGDEPAATSKVVTHFVSAELRHSSNGNVTRVFLAATIGLLTFLIVHHHFQQEALRAGFTALIVSLITIALSIACPILLSMYRWFLGLSIAITVGYYAFGLFSR